MSPEAVPVHAGSVTDTYHDRLPEILVHGCSSQGGQVHTVEGGLIPERQVEHRQSFNTFWSRTEPFWSMTKSRGRGA